MCDIFLVAGENSGDLHGEKLMQALLSQQPTLKLSGVGGARMRSLPFNCILPSEKLQVMGFIDVLIALPKIIRHFYTVANAILSLNPAVVVTIDYPGFNLRLAKYLRKKNFKGKLVHFICPSVWAWGKQRIPLMAKALDLLLCILPFEPTLFKNTQLRALFVGNPVAERIATHHYHPLSINTPLISLFPGSRRKEIERNLPLMLQTAHLIKQERPNTQFALCVSDPQFLSLIHSIQQKHAFTDLQHIPSDHSYELMKASHLAIAKSGTVTLELALHHIPTLVIYAISPLDQFIAYNILRIRLPFYCLVNIIAGTQVFSELIGACLTPSLLKAHIDLLFNPHHRAQIEHHCTQITQLLSGKHPSTEAAFQILSLLK